MVSTPIGNLGDLSQRAVEALATADLVACEDTRRTGRLLAHLGIGDRTLLRLDAHREAAGAERVLEVLTAGGRVALVSDAGTPAVSDPGQRIIQRVIASGHGVRAVPGASAVLAALVVSGLATDRFVFDGFLPRKGPERAARIGELVGERRTAVLFESPHRVAETLAELAVACGSDRPVAVCRELTKLHEEVWRGVLGEVVEGVGPVRGEVVIVLGGASATDEVDDEAIVAALDEALRGGRTRRDAVREVAARLGVARNVVYELSTGRDRPGR